MSEPRNDQPVDLVGRAVAALRELPLPSDPGEAVISQTLAALREAANRPKSSLLERIRHMPWTSKAIAALATAASLLFVYLGISNFAGSVLAFTDVVTALNSIRTATWKTTSEVKLPKNVTSSTTGIGMYLAPSHERAETLVSGTRTIAIMDGEKSKIINLVPATKIAHVIELKNLPADRENPFGRTFLGLRTLAADVLIGKAGKAEPLGSKTIDGRPAEGFRIQYGTIEATIWADPQSSLPVRVEYRTTSGPESHVVMSDFQVNVALDESLFLLEVPDDYTVQQTMQLDLSKQPIHFLADALKLAAEVNGGVFPNALRGDDGIEGTISDPKKLAEHFAAKAGNNSPETIQKLANDVAMSLGGAIGFVSSLSAENNDWHYAGKDVRLNTPDRPIFWYRNNEASATYHVLYADLTVKEVPADRVPKALDSEGNAKP